jgi:hypothetical protein
MMKKGILFIWAVLLNAGFALAVIISPTNLVIPPGINSAPVLDPINNQSATVGQLFTLQLNASDYENDTITFYDNVGFFDINSSSGIISFTPNSSLIGSHAVEITVGDGFSNTSRAFTLTVASAGSGGDTPGGSSGGSGGGSVAPPVIAKNALELSDKLIKVTLTPGAAKTEWLDIINTGGGAIVVSLVNPALSDYVLMDQTSFNLESGETRRVALRFVAPETGNIVAYSGTLIVESGAIQKKVKLIMIVRAKKPVLDINVDTKISKDGKTVEANIGLENIGDIKPIGAQLHYFIRGRGGDILDYHKENLTIWERANLNRSLAIFNLSKGAYLFFLKVAYADEVDVRKSLSDTGGKPKDKIEYPLITGLFSASLFKSPRTFISIAVLVLLVIVAFVFWKYRKKP